MPKFTKLILMSALFLSGCTREVYLQPVPCVDCQPCSHCTDLTPECCPEIAETTETIVYQVYDVPAAPTCYQPCPTCMTVSEPRPCRTVCRKRIIEPESEKSVEVMTDDIAQ